MLPALRRHALAAARRPLRPAAWRLSTAAPTTEVDPFAPIKDMAMTPELEIKANVRWDELMTEHRLIPADLVTRKKRLIYRSKQRGWLEVDLLLGTWAVENVEALNVDECDEYEAILNCETIDIFNFITGKDKCPPSLDNGIMLRLKAFCHSRPVGINPMSYELAKESANLT
ncbi:Flavinator of succinate dehydrogenase-domain-containing protein [Pelagophyceae sp. CCMP2097]|nr:Flavinator of succinate dehydrogenase-domain-containing protein [Pelagophyceae sp. CCMP2097]